MKIHLKKPVDVPAYIKTYIDEVLASSSLADALSGFVWAYDKVGYRLVALAAGSCLLPHDP
jgi:hypothetical protein